MEERLVGDVSPAWFSEIFWAMSTWVGILARGWSEQWLSVGPELLHGRALYSEGELSVGSCLGFRSSELLGIDTMF